MKLHTKNVNDEFMDNELIPLIETEVAYYIDEELRYIETIDELEELENTNCPEDLKIDIMEKISQEQISVISEYGEELDVDNFTDEDINNMIENTIESIYEDIKSEKVQIKREVFEREDFFDYEEEDEF